MTALLASLEWLLTVVLPSLLVVGFLQYAHETRRDRTLRLLAEAVSFLLIVTIILKAAAVAREVLPEATEYRGTIAVALPLLLGILGAGVATLVKTLAARLAKAQVGS